MSGPYCKNCDYFRKMPLSESGECHDPAKIITDSSGNYWNETPSTYPTFTCCNWRLAKKDQREGQ